MASYYPLAFSLWCVTKYEIFEKCVAVRQRLRNTGLDSLAPIGAYTVYTIYTVVFFRELMFITLLFCTYIILNIIMPKLQSTKKVGVAQYLLEFSKKIFKSDGRLLLCVAYGKSISYLKSY